MARFIHIFLCGLSTFLHASNPPSNWASKLFMSKTLTCGQCQVICSFESARALGAPWHCNASRLLDEICQGFSTHSVNTLFGNWIKTHPVWMPEATKIDSDEEFINIDTVARKAGWQMGYKAMRKWWNFLSPAWRPKIQGPVHICSFSRSSFSSSLVSFQGKYEICGNTLKPRVFDAKHQLKRRTAMDQFNAQLIYEHDKLSLSRSSCSKSVPQMQLVPIDNQSLLE